MTRSQPWRAKASDSPLKALPRMNKWRRYEVLLPLKFNDGRPVPDELISETLLELETSRLFVDVPDLPEHRQFFAELKGRLKSRFQQLEIWMTTYPIDVV